MDDREKVISMLKCVVNLETVYAKDCKRRGCPYAGTDCMMAVAADALALLREQEPVKAKILKNALTINYKKYAFAGICPVCNSLLLRHWVACPTCGKAVKWNG